jgi:hypothetical protein
LWLRPSSICVAAFGFVRCAYRVVLSRPHAKGRLPASGSCSLCPAASKLTKCRRMQSLGTITRTLEPPVTGRCHGTWPGNVARRPSPTMIRGTLDHPRFGSVTGSGEPGHEKGPAGRTSVHKTKLRPSGPPVVLHVTRASYLQPRRLRHTVPDSVSAAWMVDSSDPTKVIS